MMIIILILFSVLWGGVSFFALHSLQQLTVELDLTGVQQENGDIINGTDRLYYQTASAMDNAFEASQQHNSAEAEKELKQAAAAIEKLKTGLDQFKAIDHGNIDP
ncbi:TPA: hypothetical protein N3O54_005077 [Klebsiella pneumoniae]|nr:hypothetical protein [Klebsiella pneumoniae]